MKIIVGFFRKNFRVAIYYRFNFLGMLLILALVYASRLLFLDGLLQYSFTSQGFAGWDKHEIHFLLYFLMTSLLYTDSFSASILKFYQMVYQGESEPFLVKPVPIFSYLFFGWFKYSSFIIACALTVFGVYIFRDILFTHGPWGFSLFLLLFYLGILINLLFIAGLSTLTFIFKRTVPSDFIFAELSKIMSIPFSLYPRKVGTAIVLFLPSLFCTSIPCAVAAKGNFGWGLFFLCSAVLSYVLFLSIFKFALSKFEGIGG